MVGVLIVQLGTPDAPSAEALRPYLKQFLGDPRVIEDPPWFWPLLFRYILFKRPAQSAAKYARIWDPVKGSPLLHWTGRQSELLQAQLPKCVVRFGMQVGNPPLATVVDEMIRGGVERLIALPMYPQYSATTTASATDALFKSLLEQRRVPALRIVPPYYQHPAYLDAMTHVITDELARLPWRPDHFVLSFHGIPKRYAKAGDPYATHVKRTTTQLVRRLGWPRDSWTQTFQSLFGKEVWLKPYTDEVLQKLARQGKKKVFVALPGFTADCLETLDEIGNESREVFLHAGGESLHACPCLNDHPAWIDAMRTIILDESQGWM
ncbi:MAG: ferrochelatase [Planctomycetes bacterium]|jgi:ferrochelatase|nr:ferrochelatase [Planctomycetota bacterium]